MKDFRVYYKEIMEEYWAKQEAFYKQLLIDIKSGKVKIVKRTL